jgi:hypothetical protein
VKPLYNSKVVYPLELIIVYLKIHWSQLGHTGTGLANPN